MKTLCARFPARCVFNVDETAIQRKVMPRFLLSEDEEDLEEDIDDESKPHGRGTPPAYDDVSSDLELQMSLGIQRRYLIVESKDIDDYSACL